MKRATLLVMIGSPSSEVYEKFKDKVPIEFANEYQFNGAQLALPLEPDSQDLYDAIQFAESRGGHPQLFSKVAYTKKEMENWPWYVPVLPCPLELEGTHPVDYGTKYEDGCLHCGLGATPVGDVYVNRRFIKKRRMGNLAPGFFVSKDVKEILEEHKLTGISFDRRLRDYKGREFDEYYIMTIHNVLPPLSKTTLLKPGRLINETCGHRITYLQSDLQYESEKLADALDFNLTQEYLNNWKEQYIVLSARARQILRKNRVFVHYYTPVALL